MKAINDYGDVVSEFGLHVTWRASLHRRYKFSATLVTSSERIFVSKLKISKMFGVVFRAFLLALIISIAITKEEAVTEYTPWCRYRVQAHFFLHVGICLSTARAGQ